MPPPLLWAVGFAIGIVAWIAFLWLLVAGARTAVANAAVGYRELLARRRFVAEERGVAQLDAVRLDREERIRRRADSRRRIAA